MKTSTKTRMSYCWHTQRHNQGQIVEHSEAQLLGSAEGTQGAAKGLSLRSDRSDRSWEIRKGKTVIANGTGSPPSVEDAMTLADK